MAFLVSFVPHFGLMPVMAAADGRRQGWTGCGWVGEPGPGATGVFTGTGTSLTFPCPNQKAQASRWIRTLRVISQRGCSRAIPVRVKESSHCPYLDIGLSCCPISFLNTNY